MSHFQTLGTYRPRRPYAGGRYMRVQSAFISGPYQDRFCERKYRGLE
jgi:hypothetical protein